MRKMLFLTAVGLFAVTLAGCKYCDGLRRGSMTQPYNAPMGCCDTCTTCAPETPCGVCESCASGSSITVNSTKAPTMLPGPGS